MDSWSNNEPIYVIGSGAVGLGCAYALVKQGAKVTVIDRDPAGDKASFGNACALAYTDCLPLSTLNTLMSAPKWLLDPLGPLTIRPSYLFNLLPWFWRFAQCANQKTIMDSATAQWHINHRVWLDYQPMLKDIDYAHEVKQKGLLKLCKSEQSLHASRFDWQLKKDQGFQVEFVDEPRLRAMEPALSSKKQCALFLPQWQIINNPETMLTKWRQWLSTQGVNFITAEVSKLSTKPIAINGMNHLQGIVTNRGVIDCKQAVVADGAWSAKLAKSVGERCLLESERGYNTTFFEPEIHLNHMLMFAEEQFVATPMGSGIRVGGAAEFAGLELPANYKRSKVLAKQAKALLPALNTQIGTEWMGHRPSTPDTLPVIGKSAKARGLAYCFGHGHLGITQAVTSGKLLSEALLNDQMDVVAPYSIQRFDK